MVNNFIEINQAYADYFIFTERPALQKGYPIYT
jgi:hypothetical protein